MLVGYGIWDINLVFYPVSIFLKAHAFHVLRVVRVVIGGCHCAKLVVAFDKHTFRIEIGEA